MHHCVCFSEQEGNDAVTCREKTRERVRVREGNETSSMLQKKRLKTKKMEDFC